MSPKRFVHPLDGYRSSASEISGCESQRLKIRETPKRARAIAESARLSSIVNCVSLQDNLSGKLGLRKCLATYDRDLGRLSPGHSSRCHKIAP